MEGEGSVNVIYTKEKQKEQGYCINSDNHEILPCMPTGAANLGSPLSGGNPFQHCDGIFIQLQNGVALSYFIPHFNLRGQGLEETRQQRFA